MKYLCALLLSVLAGAVCAESQPEDATVEGWLELQREGFKASTVIQSATAVERERSAARWLKSFDHEIPTTYQDDSIGSD